VTEIIDGSERTMLRAIRDDASGERGTDSRQLLQLFRRGSIDIDWTNGRTLLST